MDLRKHLLFLFTNTASSSSIQLLRNSPRSRQYYFGTRRQRKPFDLKRHFINFLFRHSITRLFETYLAFSSPQLPLNFDSAHLKLILDGSISRSRGPQIFTRHETSYRNYMISLRHLIDPLVIVNTYSIDSDQLQQSKPSIHGNSQLQWNDGPLKHEIHYSQHSRHTKLFIMDFIKQNYLLRTAILRMITDFFTFNQFSNEIYPMTYTASEIHYSNTIS